jgi:SAM-dependent methyltransferase
LVTDTPVTPIDPLAPTVDGRYEDEMVVVRRVRGRQPRPAPAAVRTQHFDVLPVRGRLRISHTVPPEAVDDDLAGMLVSELFGPGWVRGPELFERIFTGVVRSSAAGALDSWELFYRNTLRRLDTEPRPGADAPHGSIAGYAPVHEHARELVGPGSALELGCCFGFLSLRLALSGRPTTAADVSPGTVGLLNAVAPRLGADLQTFVADAGRVPAPEDVADTVLAVHLLEHLTPEHGDRAVHEAVRLARRRVVVAVPFEDEPDETYGHLRTVSLEDLDAWGRGTGLDYDVHEHHGGWLLVHAEQKRPAGTRL